MRRIIAVFIIILFIAFCAIVGYAWMNPDFKASVDTSLSGFGGQIYQNIQGLWMNLLTLASTNGTTFLAYSLGMIVIGGIAWIGFKTFLWDNRPTWMGNKTSLPTVREEPRDIIITQSPTPVTQKQKEVTATESNPPTS